MEYPFGSSIKVETFVPEGIPIRQRYMHLHGTRVDLFCQADNFRFQNGDHAYGAHYTVKPMYSEEILYSLIAAL